MEAGTRTKDQQNYSSDGQIFTKNQDFDLRWTPPVVDIDQIIKKLDPEFYYE
jgi:hypothetical protein